MFIGQVSGPAKTCENLLPLSDFSRISSISWDTKHKGWIPSLEVVDEKAADNDVSERKLARIDSAECIDLVIVREHLNWESKKGCLAADEVLQQFFMNSPLTQV